MDPEQQDSLSPESLSGSLGAVPLRSESSRRLSHRISTPSLAPA